MKILTLAVILWIVRDGVHAFVPSYKSPAQTYLGNSATHTVKMMMDPVQGVNDVSNMISMANMEQMNGSAQYLSSFNTDTFLSFSDQGQNLAGIFFQASLLPYLLFLYFLQFKGNRTPNLGNFGFQFLLVFVLSTIPSGIITRSVYSDSLANCDYLHGGAEALLTITNILIVLGFRSAMTTPAEELEEKKGDRLKLKLGAAGSAVLFVAALVLGPQVCDVHAPFLFGIGDLPQSFTESLPWVTHTEPANALSIPTWAIHSSSVIEFLFAMDLIWKYAETTGNEKWKGMTWGMLPLHASGIAACTYHFFYNTPTFQALVTTQAGLTLLGNITVMIAAYRIAVSNGWTLSELNPFPASKTDPRGIIVENNAATPLILREKTESDTVLAAKLAALTFTTAYVIKYGELGLNVPFEQNGLIATAIVLGIPSITAFQFYNRSKQEGGEGFAFPSFGGKGEDGENKGLSMADVKKYGVSGTVAYVLTELAFWAVAFPVASTALYQSTGHWPDVINDTTDRATVLGFIFAGANVARLLVPLRLGAALALAPWVDENIINRNKQ